MGVLREIEAVHHAVGAWPRSDHTVLQFSGKDAGNWLQSQSTNDVMRLRSGQGMSNALLDRQGRVLAFFTTHRWEDEFWIIIEKSQLQAVLDRVESHVILEEVRVEEVGRDLPQVCVEGPRSLLFLASLFEEASQEAAGAFPVELYSFAPMVLLGHEVLVFRMTESGEDGFLLLPGPGEAQAVYAALLERGHEFLLAEVTAAARHVLRVEAGRLRYDEDVDARCVIAETPLESSSVSYEKGCYLGQEVVARLKAYGTPKQALMGLLIDGEGVVLPPPGGALYQDGRRIGSLRSSAFSPTLRSWIALAYLDREHRIPGEPMLLQVETMERPITARVAPLPVYGGTSRSSYAQKLYEEALRQFEEDARDEGTAAIELLREAVTLRPDFEDAYEALGVILHRHQRTGEAIACMNELAKLNPASVMAHTNLSVFYVSLGMIAEAEEEKALAHQLETQAQFDARAAKRAAETERERIRSEAGERIRMFQEVLEIDPEDPVATMGLGSAYIQLERHAEAVPWLELATRVKKDFSAAYLKLGQCQEILGRVEAARAAYRAGIEAAGRKGDLMPLREMERRLAALEGHREQESQPRGTDG